MNRSNYSDDIDDNWRHIMWRGAVASSIRGKRGQRLLADLLVALDAMPEKRLVAHDFQTADGEFCALGVLAKARGMNLRMVDTEEYDPTLEVALDAAGPLLREIMFVNDDEWIRGDEQRWRVVRNWVESQIKVAA